jgi:hypothetical protein
MQLQRVPWHARLKREHHQQALGSLRQLVLQQAALPAQ